jgi:hypothetical protein
MSRLIPSFKMREPGDPPCLCCRTDPEAMVIKADMLKNSKHSVRSWIVGSGNEL